MTSRIFLIYLYKILFTFNIIFVYFRSSVHTNREISNQYFLPFPGSDRSIVQRTQRLFYENEKKRPIQMNAYFGIGGLYAVIVIAILGGIFRFLARYKWGRRVLLKHPEAFSLGGASRAEIKEEKMYKQEFKFTLIGHGWPKGSELSEPTDQYKDPPTKKIVVHVTGVNPGYGATCICLLIAAKTVITETDKMPGTGGVITTGYAFAKTNLIEELIKANGAKFEVK